MKIFGHRNTIWFLILLLALVAEYVLIGWTRQFGGDAQVVSHVSFAGTIMSIVLAVVAIVYSFLQSAAQLQSANAVSASTAELADVAAKMKLSEVTLGEGLRTIGELTAKVDRVGTLTEQSQLKIQTTHMAMESLKSASVPSDPAKASISAPSASDLIARVLRASTPIMVAMYLAMIEGEADGIKTRALASDVIGGAVIRSKGEGIGRTLGEWADGIFTGTYWLLLGIGLASVKNNVIQLVPEFKEEVQKKVASTAEPNENAVLDIKRVREQFARRRGSA